MKFIGLFLMLITFISLEQEITFSAIVWFMVGVVLTCSEIIGFWIRTEIRASYKNRLPPYRSFRG